MYFTLFLIVIGFQSEFSSVCFYTILSSQGEFPNSQDELKNDSTKLSWSWCSENNCVEINAPIDVVDIENGIRGIKDTGKSAKSRFKFLSYDKENDTSIISCFPVTG